MPIKINTNTNLIISLFYNITANMTLDTKVRFLFLLSNLRKLVSDPS